ncbi:hypothetical protein GUITHDRAFT_90563 [Guillardia theta CCMP2712]|uniref:HECT-type E3 ubiquitin transferase n=1 Tax=Guillardia theta (strain CCMP2712) TaxID=905079 RepID=L1IEA0_GUITC|nr:hypothetical protein GUITHDRAFT_90563 [Guillardia theta CCMP2712]EKX34155.1 hypothetical protein GUITHDRAFT_90563 [Guillardia theta CCMP2712]|eukprot:XP_005821135.1 hypothetical protein GUITHDRAFT_90563 [Guillardia theta CCMP2712]
MEDLLPNASGRARMKELLSYLKDHGNDVKQMEALTEICEVLSMGQEDILIGFNVDSFLPVLVELLNAEHNPEIMLLSCRAITHMLEVLPKSAAKVVTSGAVPIFCQRLLNIEFIDVAEQSLLAIHKLSIEHPEPIMKANGLSAVLTFIDFFDINTQRTAVMTAANICRNMSGDSFVYVSDMLQNLTFLLSNSDQKIVESSCICFSRLVDSFAKSSVQLEQISSYGALLRLLSLLRPGDRESRGLTTGTYTLVVKTLAICCRGSSSIAISLLKENIVQTVFHIIRKEDEKLGGNALITAVAVHRPMEQLLHTLMLANEVLPPLRTDDRVTQFVRDISHGTDMTQDLYGVEGSLSQLNNFVELNPGVLVEYSELLYPILVDISVTIVNDAMRITCLSAVAKLLASLQRDELYKVVNGSQLLGYISGFIATGRPAIAGLALIVAEMLLEKLPEKLAPHFAREGVVHEVNRLCSKELAVPDTAMDALLDHARHFQATQLHTGSAAAACASSDMQLAKASQVAKRLDAGEIEVLKDLRDLFSCARETPSCYQILTSGLASSLLLWLQQRVPGRLVAFVKTFCMKNSEDEDAPLQLLVSKFNESLSLAESFPIIMSDATGDITAGIKLLAQPLKIRLVRDAGESGIADYGNNVVLIEPLATIKAVHDFLWPKVSQGSEEAEHSSPAMGAAGFDDRSEERRLLDHEDEIDEDEDEDEDEPPADITRPTPARPNQQGGEVAANGDKVQALSFFTNGRQTSEFVNVKLSWKLMRQLQDPLMLCTSSLPSWCSDLVRSCSLKMLVLTCTAFGISRALHSLQQRVQGSSSSDRPSELTRRVKVRISRIQREKIRVSRARVLPSAMRALELYASHRSILEVEYFGEAGTGLGPTLEFFTLVAQALQNSKLGLWRDSSSTREREGEEPLPSPDDVSKTPEAEEGVDEVSQAQQVHTYVVAPYGLFPAPLQPANESATLPCFLFLGRLMGKALLDQRNLDLPLSPAFFKKMVGQELTFQDLALIDPKLYQTLMKMKEAIKQRETNPSSEMTIDACRIEDLCLDMTCPGYPDVLLHPEGNNVSVTDANLHEYVEAVVQKVMGEGVEKQFEQFKKGFDEVFPMRHLRVFSPEELELHVRGDQERWDAETLRASIQPDHGYSEASLPVLWLINVMSTMDKSERRLLMRPTLPAGGLRRLTPRLTVVRKEAEAPLTADDYLPSVMTCANYLKLPEYSSEEVLRKQLFTAMREGQLCFLLS